MKKTHASGMRATIAITMACLLAWTTICIPAIVGGMMDARADLHADARHMPVGDTGYPPAGGGATEEQCSHCLNGIDDDILHHHEVFHHYPGLADNRHALHGTDPVSDFSSELLIPPPNRIC